MSDNEGMVCSLEEDVRFKVEDGATRELILINFPLSSTVDEFFTKVGCIFNYNPKVFELVVCYNNTTYKLSEKKHLSIAEAVISVTNRRSNFIRIECLDETMKVDESETTESSGGEGDINLSADTNDEEYGKASDNFESLPPAPPPLPPTDSSQNTFINSHKRVGYSLIRPDVRPDNEPVTFVGLVNQAMTCYLNSLLQALFMTPEFRNALYKWEYDGSETDESKSMPYQLQKLFLNLQTSTRSSVETTALTRSFGWDSSEAWQQHDIQELCRVMFDALEHKFKNTSQADLINQLYEGKMTDYVKCLECLTEKCREDKFLDIPLPVRPFGSAIAYSSVFSAGEEGDVLNVLNAKLKRRIFIFYDTDIDLSRDQTSVTCIVMRIFRMDGITGITCNVRANARSNPSAVDFCHEHKGVRDNCLGSYSVTFPERLNLNSFIPAHGDDSPGIETAEEAIKCDDSSTTDSGSALDEDHYSNEAANNSTSHNNYFQEDDEGIDMSNAAELEKNRQNVAESSGPYIYELFSIMIHSGSASGGHYYAYIMDFKDQEWYCFNDQSVTRIAHEDIRRTYGGGMGRPGGYYSGAYSSSTNAYMLMYRQVDPARNATAITADEFPPHIKMLKERMDAQREMETRVRERELEMRRFKVTYRDRENVRDFRVCVNRDATLKEATLEAYKTINLEDIIPLEQCRLVKYDRVKDQIICSFESKEDTSLDELLGHVQKPELLMETRAKDKQFVVYRPGDISTKILVLNMVTEDLEGPLTVRANFNETVGEYRERIAALLQVDVNTMHIALEQYSSDARILQNDDNSLRTEDFFENKRVYVITNIEDQESTDQVQKLIDKVKNIIALNVRLPIFTKDDLENLNIPRSKEWPSNVTDVMGRLDIRDSQVESMPGHDRDKEDNDKDLENREFPIIPGVDSGAQSDQSASEDSSLTDSERTIVGDTQGDVFQLSPLNSPAGSEHSSSSSPEVEDFDDAISNLFHRNRRKLRKLQRQSLFFSASPITFQSTNEKMLRILVDRRMILRVLKMRLQPFVGVPVDYFKVFRLNNSQHETECVRPNESLSMYRDEENIVIKLGRALRDDESIGNIYLLSLSAAEPIKFLCECVIARGAPALQVKRDILDEVCRKCNLTFAPDRVRLRRKQWKEAGRPYLENEPHQAPVLDEFSGSTCDLYLQLLPGPEPCTCASTQRLLFLRRWLPAELQLKNEFEEIVMETNLVTELKQKISEISSIPTENIDIAKSQVTFPCAGMTILTIVSDLEWNPVTETIDGYPLLILDHGQVIFYRDNREKLKQLTNEEKKAAFSNRNNTTSTSSSSSSSLYNSVRKERGLKIYLDTPPSERKSNDMDVD